MKETIETGLLVGAVAAIAGISGAAFFYLLLFLIRQAVDTCYHVYDKFTEWRAKGGRR